jgi:hypothetical protein
MSPAGGSGASRGPFRGDLAAPRLSDGRVCTAATSGESIALSCAYRPLLVGSGQ